MAPHGELRVPEETRPFFEELFEAVPDYTYELLDVLASDDRVVVRWRVTGRFSGGPLRGLRANGTRLEFEGVDILRIKDGLICGNDAYWDEAGSARAIGLLPAIDSRLERVLLALFNARVAVAARFRR
jgi:ketosteroid isomerase-like protein